MSAFFSIINSILLFFLLSPWEAIYHTILLLYLIGQSFLLFWLYLTLLGISLLLAFISFLVLGGVSVSVISFIFFYGFYYASQFLKTITRSNSAVSLGVIPSTTLGFVSRVSVQILCCIISPLTYISSILPGACSAGDGFCYVLIFPSCLRIPVALALGRLPLIADVEYLSQFLPGSGLDLEISGDAIIHVKPRGVQIGERRIGSQAQEAAMMLDGLRTLNPIGLNRPSFLPGPSGIKRPIKGGFKSYIKKETMKPASILAAGDALLGPKLMSGTNAENIALARPTLDGTAVRTHIPPSDRRYKELTMLAGVPLDYVPGTSAHEEAATCRRVWMKKMKELTAWAVVLMISPSLNEWHANPNGLAYYPPLVDGLDAARIAKPCGTCRASRCKLVQQAVDDERVLTGSLDQVGQMARFYHVDALWMLNIEPNIPVADIMTIMIKGDIRNGYSASHADWRCIGQGRAYCKLTTMETTEVKDVVYAAFQGSGEYAVSSEQFRAMFRPATQGNFGLRRTIIGRVHSSMLMELQVTTTGRIRSMVPDRYLYYIIPIPHPRSGIMYARLEKAGFDRTLQLFRTTPDPSIASARIALRQANVTYSISGTSLTSRVEVSASDSEFLAMWMYVYSKTMEAAESHLVSSLKAPTGHVWSFVDTLAASMTNDKSLDGNLFASKSVAQRWIRLVAGDGSIKSLDEISDLSYETLFGTEVGVGKGLDVAMEFWQEYLEAHPTVKSFVEVLRTSFSGVWSEVFGAASTLSKILLAFGSSVCDNMAFVCDLAASFAKGMGYHSWAEKITSFKDKVFDSDWAQSVANVLGDATDSQSEAFPKCVMKILKSVQYRFSLRTFVELEAEAIAAIRSEGKEANEETVKGLLSGRADVLFATLVEEMAVVISAVEGRVARTELVKQIVLQSEEAVGRCSEEQREALKRLEEALPEAIVRAEAVKPSAPEESAGGSRFAISKTDVIGQPLPIDVIYGTDGQAVSYDRAHQLHITVDLDHDALVEPRFRMTLTSLERVGDKVDWSRVHDIMDEESRQWTAGESEELPTKGEVYTVSSDDRGAALISKFVALGVKTGPATGDLDESLSTDEICRWARSKMGLSSSREALAEDWDHEAVEEEEKTGMDMSKYLGRVLSLQSEQSAPHVLHIEGVAMAGKSAGIRPLLSAEDVVVVPTKTLKADWEKEVNKLPLDRRPKILTQHVALGIRVKGKVLLDEAYQLDPAHIEALRRTPGATAFITIGDSRQIDNALSEDIPAFDPLHSSARAVVIFPTSFTPFDINVEYLKRTQASVKAKNYFNGSCIARGLRYVISDEVVIPSPNDLVINGMQRSKATMKNRGVKSRRVTAHESQGMRSDHTYIHDMKPMGTCPDLAFLSEVKRGAWYGVAITRARQSTTFVVRDRESARAIPYVDITSINGPSLKYSQQYLFSGTNFDLYDPVTVPELTYTRSSNPVTQYESFHVPHLDISSTVGSFIDPVTHEAIAKEQFISDIDLKFATKATTSETLKAWLPTETLNFNPSHVAGATEVEIAGERSSKPESEITGADFAQADKIVKEMFDKVLDPEMFFKLAEYDHSAINRHERSKFIDRLDADISAKSSSMSYAFGKNESSKKQVVLNEGAKLKLLAVLGMPPAQLLLFDEVVEALSSCFCMSLRPGIVSPFRRTKMDINDVLGAFEGAFELDLERQDQSHDRLHVAVFLRFIEMVAKRRGMWELVAAIRLARRVRSLSGIVIFLQGCGLGSGDAWTLISNMIMAFSTLLARFHVPRGSIILQIGDDITSKERLRARVVHIVRFVKAVFKIDDHMHTGRPNFTSRTAVTETTAIPTRIRGVISAGFKPRSKAMHAGYVISMKDFFREVSEIGIAAFAEMHSQTWHNDKYESEPGALENIIGHAQKIVNTPFDDLPPSLKLVTPDLEVISSSSNCFAHALARCLPNNVSAGNAYADRFRYANLDREVCIKACEDNNVKFVCVPRTYPFAKPQRAKKDIMALKINTPTLVLFKDHAILVRPFEKLDYSITKWNHVNILLHDPEEGETHWL